MSYLTWAIRRGLATGHRKDKDQEVLRGGEKKMPPQRGEKKAAGGRTRPRSNGHGGHVGGRGCLKTPD